MLVLNFFLFRILPGDPERTFIRLQRISPSQVEEIKREFGLDRPLWVQFFDYLVDTARGELGVSYVFSRPVAEVIGTALWPTILLVGVSTVAATLIGTLMGIWGAWRRGSPIDTSLLGFGLVTYAMPEFWLGMLLILGFAVALGWFPTSFMTTPGLVDVSAGAQFVDTMEHLFLPALTLALALIGEYALIMRSSVMEVMYEEYVTTARAKGMREALVLRKHIVPNALLVPGSICKTPRRSALATHTDPPPNATADGSSPTSMVVIWRVSTSTRDTVPSRWFATHTDPAPTAAAFGPRPTANCSDSAPLSGSIRPTEFSSIVEGPSLPELSTTAAMATASSSPPPRATSALPRRRRRRTAAGPVAWRASIAGSWVRIERSSCWRCEPGSRPSSSSSARWASR